MKKLIIPFLLLSSIAMAKITVTEIKGDFSSNNVKGSYIYPQFELDGKPITNLNSDFSNKAKELKKKLNRDDEFQNQTWEYEDSFENHENNFNVTSIVLFDSFYEGGAHGTTVLSSLILDNKTGKELTFDDIFNPKLKKKFIEDMKDNVKLVIEKADPKASMYVNNEIDLDGAIFFFDKNDFVIKFQSYEVASFAAGFPEFRLSKQYITPYLTKQFLKNMKNN